MWKVAPSYKDFTLITVDESSKKALVEARCDRCAGTGIWGWYVENGHPAGGGVCYKCGGSGKISKWVKAYTENEYEKYVASQERQREKRRLAEEQRIQDLENNSDTNKKVLLAEWGYDPFCPTVYLIAGENTYGIKDYLKEKGCKFNKNLGWYSPSSIDLPEGYTLAPIDFDDLYDWFPRSKTFTLKETAKETAEAAVAKILPPSASEWVGEEKERLRDLNVVLISTHQIDGYYGTTTIYTFKYNENILVWMTSSCKDIQVGDNILLTGTVKEHSLYKGIKQTKLSRCIIKEVE